MIGPNQRREEMEIGLFHKHKTVQQAILWKRKFTSLGTKLKSQQESELKVKANLISDRKGARKHGGSE